MEKKITSLDKITFLFLGISATIGGQAILASLQYYTAIYPNFNVFVYFPIPLQISTFIFCFIMPALAQKYKIPKMLIVTLIMLALFFLILFVTAISMPEDAGFYTTIVVLFFIGSANAVSQNTTIATSFQEGGKLNEFYWICAGLSGLVTVGISILCQSFLLKYITICIGLFLLITTFMIVLTVFLTRRYQIIKSQAQQQSLLKNAELQQTPKQSEEQVKLIQQDTEKCGETQKLQKIEQQSKQSSESIVDLNDENLSKKPEKKPVIDPKKLGIVSKVKIGVKFARSIPFFLFLCYMTTYSLYPNVMIGELTFKFDFLNKQSRAWGIILLTLTFNVGGILGRLLCVKIKVLNNLLFAKIMTIVRLGFYPLAIYLVEFSRETTPYSRWDDIWFFVQIFVFSMTNGGITAIMMAHAPKRGLGDKPITAIIGFINAFFLKTGVAFGCLLALALQQKPEQLAQ